MDWPSTVIDVENARWILSTTAQCLAAIIGLILVGYIYLSQRSFHIIQELTSKPIQVKVNAKELDDVEKELPNRLKDALHGVFGKFVEPIYQKTLAQMFARNTVAPLMSAMILCLIGLFAPQVSWFVIVAFGHSLVAIGYVWLNLFLITGDYESFTKKQNEIRDIIRKSTYKLTIIAEDGKEHTITVGGEDSPPSLN